MIVAFLGFAYIGHHFYTNGLDLNFNIMIFIFLMVGLLLHKSPMRYVISMKRSSSNVSGILFQYPFYAGIMGIMLYTGLGERLAQVLASVATVETYPFFAYISGAFVNFAIPSAGGEFAVIGPSIIEAVKEISMTEPNSNVQAMIARASLSIAYGESMSNMLQPFYLLLVMPIMSIGTKLQARDVVGYLFIPVILFLVVQTLMILFIPF
jgi:short-chain fatty acids transporter